VLRLVFEKQYECVRHSARIVVPSAPMRDVILRCYPWCEAKKIAVLPWGNIAADPIAAGMPLPRGVDEDEVVILTLSRLSPEKGIERLLAALPLLNTSATKVTNVPIEFTGHVVGERKAALLQRADIFVSPSKHESYGLTIAEALAAGCRVISHHHYGAEGDVVDCSDPKALARVLSTMITRGRTPKTGIASHEPSQAARKLAELLAATAELPAERSHQQVAPTFTNVHGAMG